MLQEKERGSIWLNLQATEFSGFEWEKRNAQLQKNSEKELREFLSRSSAPMAGE
ncbi:hypothetical protein [Phormidesmis priestleyi]